MTAIKRAIWRCLLLSAISLVSAQPPDAGSRWIDPVPRYYAYLPVAADQITGAVQSN